MTAPAPFTSTGYHVYDPSYNAPLTPAELDLFKRLQSGDPVLRQQYIDKYGPTDPATGTGGWYDAWTKDQDYWVARYNNQTATPETMARLQQDTLSGAGYPYTIFQLNALTAMQSAGTLDAYLAGFRDQNLAGYMAAVLGRAYVGGSALTPTADAPNQSPTFTPTTTGQGPVTTSAPPTVSGPIAPAPSDPGTGTSNPTTIPVAGPGTPAQGPTPNNAPATTAVPINPTPPAAPGGGSSTPTLSTILPAATNQAAMFTLSPVHLALGAGLLLLVVFLARGQGE